MQSAKFRLLEHYPLYLGNRPQSPNKDLEVNDKFTGEVVTRVPLADDELVNQAVSAAVAAAKPMAKLAAYERQAILDRCLEGIARRTDELVQVLCIEGGKPLRDAKSEVGRLIDTFRIASGEAVRIMGEVMPLDISARTKAYWGMWRRVPVGPCSFITPFNFPVNLVAHKIAPAIAVGCPFILKPASFTPVSALILGEILAASGLPEGAFSILPCKRDGAERFTTDDRLKLLSFTGSPIVGWDLKAKAGKKRVVLELGGNAACVIDETADLADALERCLIGAFSQSGQSCISVQRILVHESKYPEFRDRLTERVRQLKCGDPRLEETVNGPLISESEAIRLEKWIQSAVAKGAKLLCGGKRSGANLEPALLENVPEAEPLCREEAFGPLAVLSSFKRFEDAMEEVNRGRFGLQAGVFTKDLYRAKLAWDMLEVGGVIIGDVPSFRVDSMPYGGVKDSGFGREGVRFAMEDMTEIRLLAVRGLS